MEEEEVKGDLHMTLFKGGKEGKRVSETK